MSGLLVLLPLLLIQSASVESESPFPLSIEAQPFAFKAAIVRGAGVVPETMDPARGIVFEGAFSGPRWCLESDGFRAACDGDRVWRRDGGTMFVEPISNQVSIPLEGWMLPYLLQIGDKLHARWTESHGRWTRWSSSPELSVPSEGERRIIYAWNSGGWRIQHAYGFKQCGDGWFCHEYISERSADGRSGKRSVYRMSDPVAVGVGFCARRLHSQGWVASQKDPNVLEAASGFVGELLNAEPLTAAEFDARFMRYATITAGDHVLDRTRPAALAFVAGQRAADFDGVGYEFAMDLASPPSDSQLMELLRSARRVVERDQKSVPVGGVQPLGDVGAGVEASGAVTSAGVVLEPGRNLDLGMVRFGESPTKTVAKFQLRNTGDKTRTIKSVKASCGCTETAVDQNILAPGATATITTTLTVERAKTYHSSIWVAFESDGSGPGQVEELQIVAVGVPEKAIRATALKKDAAGDVLTIVLYSTEGKPEGDVGVPKGAESTIASDSGWLPVGGDAKTAKHWIRDIVKKP